MIILAAVVLAALPAAAFLATAGAQTRNQSNKAVFTEHFEFPNECTNELMDVTDTTTITCHDQLRADGLRQQRIGVAYSGLSVDAQPPRFLVH